MAQNNQYPFSISGSGDHVVITGEPGTYFQVLRVLLSNGTETTVQFKSNTTILSGAQPMLALLLDDEDRGGDPWYVTGKGENLVISLGANVSCDGTIWGRFTG